ncbi:MAG TPA: imidazole glycerol phosphate synthase subunit HisH, partial [Eubacterium sp.]|nr:imidazole glycerol phosphate synthase subunit HisH [Eubacterium sp.]
MIAIVDYGVGNIFSLVSSFSRIGADIRLTGDPEEIRSAEKVILPGVGAFRDAAE